MVTNYNPIIPTKVCYYKKTLTLQWLDHHEVIILKKNQFEFDNIHILIIAGILTNKEELVQVNWYDAIATNDETENNLYIVRFTYVPYIIQEDVETDGNQLASGDLV